MLRAPPISGGLASTVPLLAIGVLVVAAAVQLFWGPLSDDRFGPFSAVVFLMAVSVALLSMTIAVWPRKPESSWLLGMAVPLLFAAAAAAQLAASFGFELGPEPLDDIVDLLPSLAAAGALLVTIHSYGSNVSFCIVVIAFALQSSASLFDVFDDRLVANTLIESVLADWATMIASGLALAGYACALLIEVSRHFPPQLVATKGRISLVRLFNEVEYTRIGKWLSARVNDADYLVWRLANEGAYSDFYAAQIARKLAGGKSHKTLGGKQYGSGSTAVTDVAHDVSSFASRGSELFDLCKKLSLSEHDIVVDYGCGSLRIGQHFIRFLRPGGYWGLDVTDSFYKIGLALLPEELLERKHPHCHVINHESLAAAHGARPSFIICNAVLKHVPESEFGVFMDRLFCLAHSGTRIILTFHSAAVFSRIKGKSWAYPAEEIREAIRSRLPDAQIEDLPASQESGRGAVPIRREKWLIIA